MSAPHAQVKGKAEGKDVNEVVTGLLSHVAAGRLPLDGSRVGPLVERTFPGQTAGGYVMSQCNVAG